MKRFLTAAAAGIVLAGSIVTAEDSPRRANPHAKLHRFSTTVEKERPRLNDETRRMIAA